MSIFFVRWNTAHEAAGFESSLGTILIKLVMRIDRLNGMGLNEGSTRVGIDGVSYWLVQNQFGMACSLFSASVRYCSNESQDSVQQFAGGRGSTMKHLSRL